jgi:hypothetical protein
VEGIGRHCIVLKFNVFALCIVHLQVGSSFKRTNKEKLNISRPMPEIIDPVFAKTSQNDRFLLSENERFGLVFVKTGSINSGTRYKSSLVAL